VSGAAVGGSAYRGAGALVAVVLSVDPTCGGLDVEAFSDPMAKRSSSKRSRVRGIKRSMHDPNFILFLDAVLCGLDRIRSPSRACDGPRSAWLGGTVTREHQPGPYWRCVYLNWAVLAFFAAIFVAMMSWPDFFQ
jgi:hypothetical protein